MTIGDVADYGAGAFVLGPMRFTLTILLLTALLPGMGACTNKEPIVDTGLSPPTDVTYNGTANRRVDRGWRLVHDDDVRDAAERGITGAHDDEATDPADRPFTAPRGKPSDEDTGTQLFAAPLYGSPNKVR